MGYGILTQTDVRTLEAWLAQAAEDGRMGGRVQPFRMFEVGVHSGETARGMRAHLLGHCEVEDLRYVGIDSQRDMPIAPPFPGATMVYGDSSEVYAKVATHGPFDFGFIDGCHCINHVMLDVLHYGDLVRRDGLLLLHDSGRAAQGSPTSYQQHGPKTPDFSIAIREALRKLGIYSTGAVPRAGHPFWQIEEEADEGREFGGVTVLRRVA